MSKNETFLYNIDTNRVEELMKDTNENVKYFNEVSLNTSEQYTKHLDECMKKIYKNIVKPNDVSNEILEKYYLELTNLIYFIGDKLEQLNIYSDLAKASEKEVYNNAYLANQIKDTEKKNKTTVAENQAVAEKESQYEAAVTSIYEHAYKIVKFKIDAAKDMVSTLRKVISRRMQEQSLSMYSNKDITNYSMED